MGNKYTVDFDKLIESYVPGDVEKFESILNTAKDLNDQHKNIWKLSCLYYFIMNLDETEHDIGESQAAIISNFSEIESEALDAIKCHETKEKGLEILKYIYLATGYKKYDFKENFDNDIGILII